jgi:hypothetical protein
MEGYRNKTVLFVRLFSKDIYGGGRKPRNLSQVSAMYETEAEKKI